MKLLRSSPRWLGLAWKVTAVAAIVLALVVGLGQGNNSASAAATFNVNVGQQNGGSSSANQYNPNDITIYVGDTIQWDRFAGTHDVTPVGVVPAGFVGTPEGDLNEPGESYSFTFDTAGTVWYYCENHSDFDDVDTSDDGVVDGSDTPNWSKMIGKITVLPAVPDITLPTTTAVAASPNPTEGAGSVTLTATVTDSGTPLGTIASAEYRINSGTPVAMSAVDSLFNATSEDVQANILTSSLSDGVNTVEVRGTDDSANASPWVALAGDLDKTPPPAGAVPATLTITPGSLSLTTTSIDLGSIALSGLDQTVGTFANPAWSVTDARGDVSAGWHVTVSSTDFTGAGTITVDNFKMRLEDTAITVIGGNLPPTSLFTSYQPLSGAPSKFLSAAFGNGMGTYDLIPDFSLLVPADSVPGDYGASLTVTLTTGP
jgi:plastocyanin